MTPIDELKVQAKKLLKHSNLSLLIPLTSDNRHQLKHTQLYLARKLGFNDWAQAKTILSCDYDLNPQTASDNNFGSLWYTNKCGALLNTWCRNYEEAIQVQAKSGGVVLPYKTQFILAKENYFEALNIPFQKALWLQVNNDWCRGDIAVRHQLLLPLLRNNRIS